MPTPWRRCSRKRQAFLLDARMERMLYIEVVLKHNC